MKTGNKPQGPNCPLASLVVDEKDPEEKRRELEEIKSDGFNTHGIFVVSLNDWRLTNIERQVVEGIGKRIYRRKHGA